MNACIQTIKDYGLRSIGYGERLLPKSDFTLCEQFTLIGSGLLWNIYFGVLALCLGFFAATAIALAKGSNIWILRKPAQWFVFIFRGSPLFIQFFLFYELFVLLPKMGWDLNFGIAEISIESRWLTRAWMGALIVLFLNTTAYTAEIFYGALKSIPKGDIEAADAYGLSGWNRFRRVIWPTMLRLAWPAYTNEAIFMFHATTLVYFSGFPAWKQKGDALYYASYFADKTFNPFIPYPILAMYFIMLTMLVIGLYSLINTRLNKHLKLERRQKIHFKPQMFR
jgi:polar amino acid transport system permease protein